MHRVSFQNFARYAKHRAVARRLDFDLTASALGRVWLEQGGTCFWTGVPIGLEHVRARHPLRPSVDRLDLSKGYVTDNVVWSSNFANRARGDLPALDFAELMYALGFPSRLDDSRLLGLSPTGSTTEQQEE